jgi:hypothetical protein
VIMTNQGWIIYIKTKIYVGFIYSFLAQGLLSLSF